MRYLIIDETDQRVINTIIWDGITPWQPEPSRYALSVDEIGVPGISLYWTKIDGRWVRPRPFPSWTLDSNYDWQPPTPMPTDGNWVWDEEIVSWTQIIEA